MTDHPYDVLARFPLVTVGRAEVPLAVEVRATASDGWRVAVVDAVAGHDIEGARYYASAAKAMLGGLEAAGWANPVIDAAGAHVLDDADIVVPLAMLEDLVGVARKVPSTAEQLRGHVPALAALATARREQVGQ